MVVYISAVKDKELPYHWKKYIFLMGRGRENYRLFFVDTVANITFHLQQQYGREIGNFYCMERTEKSMPLLLLRRGRFRGERIAK